MGQIEQAIDRARRNIVGKSGPWRFDVLKTHAGEFGTLYHYGTPIFRVNLKTGAGEVGQGAWASVSDQTGIRKAARYLSQILGGAVEVKALSKKEIVEKRDRARAKGQAFSNPPGKLPTKRTGAFRLDEDHAHIGRGLVYCKTYRDSAPPVVTHSRVKCGLCGKTVQSATNPPEYPSAGGWVVRVVSHLYDFPTVVMHNKRSGRLAYLQATDDGEKWSHASDVPAAVKKRARAVLKYRGARENPRKVSHEEFKGRLLRAPERVRALKFLRAHPGWQSFDPSAYKVAEELAAQGLVEIVRHKKPATWQVRARRSNPVPSFALMLRRKLAQGYDPEEADKMARRELRQAEIFLEAPRKGFSENPPRRAGKNGPVKIYGHTEKIFMQKTGGPYKGQRFVHDFKPGVEQYGLPRNTRVQTPDGREFRLSTRSVVLTGKKDIWRNFPA